MRNGWIKVKRTYSGQFEYCQKQSDAGLVLNERVANGRKSIFEWLTNGSFSAQGFDSFALDIRRTGRVEYWFCRLSGQRVHQRSLSQEQMFQAVGLIENTQVLQRLRCIQRPYHSYPEEALCSKKEGKSKVEDTPSFWLFREVWNWKLVLRLYGPLQAWLFQNTECQSWS